MDERTDGRMFSPARAVQCSRCLLRTPTLQREQVWESSRLRPRRGRRRGALHVEETPAKRWRYAVANAVGRNSKSKVEKERGGVRTRVRRDEADARKH